MGDSKKEVEYSNIIFKFRKKKNNKVKYMTFLLLQLSLYTW